MKSPFITRVLTTSAFVLGAFALAVAAQSAWTPPTLPPPQGNVSAPINVGDVLQTKLGSLWIRGGLNVDGNLLIATGSPAVGRVLTAVDNLGTVKWQDPTGGNEGGTIVLFDTPVSIAASGSGTITIDAGIDYGIPANATELLIFGEVGVGYLRFRHPGHTIWKSFLERDSGEDYIAEGMGWFPLSSQGKVELSYQAVYTRGIKLYGYKTGTGSGGGGGGSTIYRQYGPYTNIGGNDNPGPLITQSLGIHDVCFLQTVQDQTRASDYGTCNIIGTIGGSWSLEYEAATCKVICAD